MVRIITGKFQIFFNMCSVYKMIFLVHIFYHHVIHQLILGLLEQVSYPPLYVWKGGIRWRQLSERRGGENTGLGECCGGWIRGHVPPATASGGEFKHCR